VHNNRYSALPYFLSNCPLLILKYIGNLHALHKLNQNMPNEISLTSVIVMLVRYIAERIVNLDCKNLHIVITEMLIQFSEFCTFIMKNSALYLETLSGHL
jgi:hypothetical protein